MANSTDRQRASALLLDDESLINKLKDDEAKALIDWAMFELDTNDGTLDAHVKGLVQLRNPNGAQPEHLAFI